MTEPQTNDAQDEHVDGCVEHIELGETEATLDVELPPARGGVEPSVSSDPHRGG